MLLIELRDDIKAGKRLYRKAWPAYAAWTYRAGDPLHFIDRRTHVHFWTVVMCEDHRAGLPGPLERADVYADDWDRLD